MGTLTEAEHVCGLRYNLRSSVEPHPFSPSCVQGITQSAEPHVIQLLYLEGKVKGTPTLPSRSDSKAKSNFIRHIWKELVSCRIEQLSTEASTPWSH